MEVQTSWCVYWCLVSSLIPTIKVTSHANPYSQSALLFSRSKRPKTVGRSHWSSSYIAGNHLRKVGSLGKTIDWAFGGGGGAGSSRVYFLSNAVVKHCVCDSETLWRKQSRLCNNTRMTVKVLPQWVSTQLLAEGSLFIHRCPDMK